MDRTSWIEEATKMFYQYRNEANKYNSGNEDIETLCLINAGKAVALSELLEKFGSKPEV